MSWKISVAILWNDSNLHESLIPLVMRFRHAFPVRCYKRIVKYSGFDSVAEKYYNEMWSLSTGIFILLGSYGTFSKAGPLGSLQFGSSGIQLENLQHTQFTESIIDWLRDMKTRIFDDPSALPDLASIIDTTRESYEQQKKILDRLIVDMSNVEFNPEKDWGFQLGHWYLIRKSSDDAMSSLWTLVRPRNPPESTTSHSWLDSPSDKVDIPSSFNTIIPIEPTTVEKIPETVGNPNAEDNETSEPSAEVIAPKN